TAVRDVASASVAQDRTPRARRTGAGPAAGRAVAHGARTGTGRAAAARTACAGFAAPGPPARTTAERSLRRPGRPGPGPRAQLPRRPRRHRNPSRRRRQAASASPEQRPPVAPARLPAASEMAMWLTTAPATEQNPSAAPPQPLPLPVAKGRPDEPP